MVAEELCRELSTGLAKKFICRNEGELLHVRTPFVYPDGQVIDLYFRDDALVATDLGETLRWLDSHSWADKRTAAQRRLIQEICRASGVVEKHGSLSIEVGSPAASAEAVTRLAQAAARVADVWFTFRLKTFTTIRDEVGELLEEERVPHERNVVREGVSGKQWTIDFHTSSGSRSSLVQILATGSRSASSRLTDHTVAAWVDLRESDGAGSADFVSLFDDTVDVWRDEDFRQLESHSKLAFWSEPVRLLNLLGAPSPA